MVVKTSREKGQEAEKKPPKCVYEAPAISWQEAYEPVGFGISCAQTEGNPGCFPGPIFT